MSLFPVFDHIALNVRQRLDEAFESFARLGFTLTPRGYHSMGSANHLAIFATDYLELLGLPPDAPMGRPELIEWPYGINGLVFGAEDLAHVERELAARGVPATAPRAFTRPVTLADGSSEEARFTTLTVDRGAVDYGRVYFCQHGTRRLVWRDEFRAHPNGAVGLAAVVIAARDPKMTAAVYRRMFGADAVRAADDGFTMAVGLGRLDILSQAAAIARYGATPGDETPAHMKALVIRLRSLETAKGALGPLAQDIGGRLIVAGEAAFGAAIEFVA
jgi:hypothetical protein